MNKENQIKKDIENDIKKITDFLNNRNKSYETTKEFHIMMDGKYQSRVNNWGKSCYGWYETHGFVYSQMGLDGLIHNLKNMKSKLEGYLQTFSLNPNISSKTINYYNTNTNTIDNQNTNTNTNKTEIKIDFKQIEKNINNMESLTNEETKEALEKLKELETIYNSKLSRKNKWETAKKILLWVTDKSVDIAIAYFPIIMEILNH